MDRIALKQLKEWKNKKNRKPLIIQGARQVGKTWLMKEFGRQEYKKVVYVSFDRNESLKSTFTNTVDVSVLIAALEIDSGIKITAKDTLIILD